MRSTRVVGRRSFRHRPGRAHQPAHAPVQVLDPVAVGRVAAEVALAGLGDETGLEQHREVVGRQRLGHVDRPGQIAGAARPPAQVAEHQQAMGLSDDRQVLGERPGLVACHSAAHSRHCRT